MSNKQEFEYLKKRNVELEAQVKELQCYIEAMSTTHKQEVDCLKKQIFVISNSSKRIKYKDFEKLNKNELSDYSSRWIKFEFRVNGKLIDPNSIIPLGAVYHFGEYYVEGYTLDDISKRFIIHLTNKED